MRLLLWAGVVCILWLPSPLGLAWIHPALPKTHFRAAVGAPFPAKIAEVDGVAIAYSDTGDEGLPAIVCLHAIGHGARDYQDLSRRLHGDYRVIALDFPGQGNSGPDRYPASATRYAELLTGFIEQLDLHSVTLIGNSIGGATAIRYAAAHPAKVTALVLCDSGGLGAPNGFGRAVIWGIAQYFGAGARGAAWFPSTFARYYQKILITAPANEERERIVRSAFEIAPVLRDAWTSFADPRENLWPMLPQIHCPVLLAWAKHDVVIPWEPNQGAFARFPDHRLALFEAGHAAFLEDPDHFERELRTFLN